ncbi:MAG: methylenetetrahydrofolate reductase C-terminal domain-containing protein [Candidatus Omnitrophica bacterium]|nr:methylenetetrahydrofolate reductase C-terminal domain-containing protein [Candidatus Omnitrophota bacterium]
MIVSQKKPFEEILKALDSKNKVFLVGCGDCATTCKTGGEKEILEMKKLLEEEGKTITGWAIPDSPCIASQVKMVFAKNKKAIDETDAFLVLSCGLGVQSVLDNDTSRLRPSASPRGERAEADRQKRLVCTGCDTLFGSVVDKTGVGFFERCAMCGECVLNITGGICPVTRCAKGLLNGPCGGSDKGKCEIDKDQDCAWILIYNRLKELGSLENMKKRRPAKDYSKTTKPRKLLVKGE